MSWFKSWSNSSLTTIQMCGEKFRLRYLEKDRRPSGPQAKRGIAIHYVAKEAHKRQMVDLGRWEGATPQFEELPGSDKSKQEAADIAASIFEKEWKDGVAFSPKDKETGIEKVKAEQKDVAVSLSKLYVGDVAPVVVPAAVERKVVIHPKSMDITLTGYIDLVQEDAPPQGTIEIDRSTDVIRDLKTAEKAPWKGAAAVSQQLTMYHLIRLADVKKMPRKGRLVHLIRTPKLHELSVVTQETERDMDDINVLAHRIRAAVAAVDKGIFIPADPAAPGSPCSWCEFADGTCKYVRKVGRPIPEGE